MNKIKTSTEKGFTLHEMLIVIFLITIVSVVTYQIFFNLGRYYQILDTQTDLLRQKRAVLSSMGMDVKNATYLYPGTSVTIEGVTYSVPAIDGTGGTELLLAVPEYAKTTGMISSYTVIGYYLVQNTKDPDNKNTYNLVRRSYSGAVPSKQGDPTTIDLAGLKGGVTRICARYIVKSAYILSIGSSGRSISLTASFMGARSRSGRPSQDQISFTMNRRNI